MSIEKYTSEGWVHSGETHDMSHSGRVLLLALHKRGERIRQVLWQTPVIKQSACNLCERRLTIDDTTLLYACRLTEHVRIQTSVSSQYIYGVSGEKYESNRMLIRRNEQQPLEILAENVGDTRQTCIVYKLTVGVQRKHHCSTYDLGFTCFTICNNLFQVF